MSNSNGTIRKIGLDPGFSSLKIAEVQGPETITTHLIPSTVGLPTRAGTGRRGFSLSCLGLARRGPQPDLVAWERFEYLVGSGVADHTQPQHQMDFDRFTDSPSLRASLYASLYKIVNGGSHQVALAIALPVPVIEDESEAQQIERKMKSWLVGDHHFTVNGVEAHIEITAIRAKIPQPIASWMEWGLDWQGRWIKGTEALNAPVLVIDQGFNTLDVLVVQNRRVLDRLTGGDTLGMRRAAERLMETIYRQYRLKVDLLEADTLIRTARTGRAEISLDGEPVEITQQARQALWSLETDVTGYLEKVREQQRAYWVILTGGGALTMVATLTKLFPKGTVPFEAILANARGLGKMAQRKGFLA